MARAAKPKLGYTMKKVTLNKSNISEFYSDQVRRRMIREGKVKGFIRDLNAGKHFSSPFVTNRTGVMSRVIDGNHRHEAVVQVIARTPTFSIDVWVAEYKNLTLEEEKDIFALWNCGTKQSTDDWVKIWFETFPYGDEFLRKVPANVYGTPTKIKVRLIAGAHITAKRAGAFNGGYTADGPTAVAHFAAITKKDIDTMAAFMRDMEKVFGPYNSSDIFWKSTHVQAMYKIWYDNLRKVPHVKMMAAWKAVFKGSAEQMWRANAKQSGREATKAYYLAAINALNMRGSVNFVMTQNIPVPMPEPTMT